jgi:hypothetical protein
METWIKLYRKLEESSFYHDSRTVHLWVHLLLKAYAFEGKTFFGGEEITVNPGQFVTGRKKLSKETDIDESKIQRSLKMFEKCLMIEQQTNNQSRLITVLNWEQYQGSEQQTNNKRTTNEQRVNTIRERKKVIKKEKNNIHFDKLFSDYPNTKGSKSQTLKNYETCKKLFSLTDDQIYLSCMNSVEKQKQDGSGDYIFQLSNVLGLKYRDDLKTLIEYKKPIRQQPNQERTFTVEG